ncbi:MAG: Fur family transcriptional regulator [Candidatus Nanopelagicales bacterium]
MSSPVVRPTAAVPGQRATRQRAAVATLLDSVEGFRSAQELHTLLRQRGDHVGLTTVYRTLTALAEAGEVDSILREDGEAVYRRCEEASHHHHLVCRACGRTVEVDGPEVERWARTVASAHGYSDVSHTLEIFGRCAECTDRDRVG